MKFFSDCSGDCKDCFIHYNGGCIAGHGDDHFVEITETEAKQMIQQNKLTPFVLNQLLNKFPNLENKSLD